MEGALPLGIITEADFSVATVHLNPGDSIILMSDGIVEATDADGNLFGFERIAAMLDRHATAAEIAEAAQKFGQEDDILVLQVRRERDSVSTPQYDADGAEVPA
jgi:serine phosphatase RsbU (regulator of sigma subunit)